MQYSYLVINLVEYASERGREGGRKEANVCYLGNEGISMEGVLVVAAVGKKKLSCFGIVHSGRGSIVIAIVTITPVFFFFFDLVSMVFFFFFSGIFVISFFSPHIFI